MQPQTTKFDVPVTNGEDGAPVDVSRYTTKAIQFVDVNGTLQIMGSIDGDNFVQIGSNVSGAEIRQITDLVVWIQIHRSGGTGVDDAATLFGLDTRADG